MQLHLNGYGAKLRVKEGLFNVIHAKGLEVRQQTFAASQVDAIFLQKGTSVSTDAILLAMEYDVALLVTDHRGFPLGRFAAQEPHTISLVQKAQALVSSRQEGLAWARVWIAEKMEAQRAFLAQHAAYLKGREKARWEEKTARIANLREKLLLAPLVAETLRGIEGSAGRIFYYLVGQSLPAQYRFVRRTRRPATDPFNAFLNYAYALLYVRVESALIEFGMNPYLGFMHRNDYRQKSLVFDFIEPFRMDTFRVVYRLFAGKSVSAKHYAIEPDGSVWLSTEGKRLLLEQLKAEYEDKRRLRDHTSMTAGQYVRRRASHLAQQLLEFSPPAPEGGVEHGRYQLAEKVIHLQEVLPFSKANLQTQDHVRLDHV